jgi:hypothetical protein
MFPGSPALATATFQLSPDFRPRASSNASSCGRMSPFRSVPVDAEWATYSTASGGFHQLLGQRVYGEVRRPASSGSVVRCGAPSPSRSLLCSSLCMLAQGTPPSGASIPHTATFGRDRATQLLSGPYGCKVWASICTLSGVFSLCRVPDTPRVPQVPSICTLSSRSPAKCYFLYVFGDSGRNFK